MLENDTVWQAARALSDLPPALVERLEHYFATYKLVGTEPNQVALNGAYDREHALAVVEASLADYSERYGS